jgi:hypothetical protein
MAQPAEHGSTGPRLLGGGLEREQVDVARAAALAMGVAPNPDSARPVAIVFPGYEERDALERSAQPLNQPWMAAVLGDLRRDAELAAAAARADVGHSAVDTTRFAAVARAASTEPLVLAARGVVDGREQLLLLIEADAGSLVSAALIAATYRALSGEPPASELEPSSLSDDLLASWQRPASPAVLPTTPDGNRESDGRWFWLVVLVLLIAESVLRRSTREVRAEPAMQMPHERVA